MCGCRRSHAGLAPGWQVAFHACSGVMVNHKADETNAGQSLAETPTAAEWILLLHLAAAGRAKLARSEWSRDHRPHSRSTAQAASGVPHL